MNARLDLLYHGKPTENLRRLKALAEFFGISAALTEIGQHPCAGNAGARPSAIVVDVASFAEARDEPAFTVVGTSIAALELPALLLLTDESCAEWAAKLSHGVVQSVVAAQGDCVRFSAARGLADELASHTFQRSESPALHLGTKSKGPASTIMEVGAGAAFIHWQTGTHPKFAWATTEVTDSTAVVQRESDFETALDRLLPFLIFLRRAFGEACWHNPHRDAGFIVDDPLLTHQYGFIDFRELLASARRNSYHVTLAFIPWNGWRTRRSEIDLFRHHADCFTVCVHGCDHNSNEYGLRNYDVLLDRNRVAIERMDRQSGRINLPYTPIMVCPQEQCSIEAWRSFADNHSLLAMMNTACLPRHTANTVVSIQDLLLPAHDALFGFPIFKRYYPGSPCHFALSLFLGRPAILVEHHDYFCNGVAAIEEFVRQLHNTCPQINWRNPQSIVTSTHLRRDADASTLDVRFFTNRFTLDACPADKTVARLRKRVPQEQAVRQVLVNQRSVPFRHENEFLHFTLELTAPSPYAISVDLMPVAPRRIYSFSPWYQGRVATRRILSEFRDNVISRNPRAMAIAQSAVRALGLTVKRGERKK